MSDFSGGIFFSNFSIIYNVVNILHLPQQLFHNRNLLMLLKLSKLMFTTFDVCKRIRNHISHIRKSLIICDL